MAITIFRKSKQLPFRAYSKVIGIARETKGLWECRAPLTPTAVRRLTENYDLQFKVESSRKRIFRDYQYAENNALIVPKLEGCDLILGVKQPPIEQILPNTAYLFFSHTHKGQPSNMPLLKRICDVKSSLYDYELLSDPETGQRLVAFGKFAGYSGMIMALHGLGLALLQRGIKSSFLNIPQTQIFPNVQAAKAWLSNLSLSPIDFGPLVFVFTGTGRVSQGAQEIFKCLPHEFVTVDQLPSLMKSYRNDRVYGCVVEAKDFVVSTANGHFNRTEYYAHPERFRSHFHESILPYTSVLINGIYWEPQFPRILETGHLSLAKNLLSIADISCDLNGSIEFTSHASTIDVPFWNFNGIQMMTIDNLPAQLPQDASEYFSSKLEPLIPAFAGLVSEGRVVGESRIVGQGNIVEKFAQLKDELSKIERKKKALILGSGHVSGPVIEYLKAEDIDVIVAANEDKPGVIKLNVQDPNQSTLLHQLIQEADIVISLISAHLHVGIAEACIQHKRPLVTASYISPQMQALHSKAQSAGVLLLNEIGLDPGLDHLTAMEMIREAHRQKWKVESFVSWCGGLPAPEDSNNILGYKFSWSPRGVLLAAQNSARYLRDGRIVEIEGNDLLLSAQRVTEIAPGFAFEGLPNRDALKYQKIYGLEDDGCKTVLRGTLRYVGFSELLEQFRRLGLMDQTPIEAGDWLSFLKHRNGLQEITTQTLMHHLNLTLFAAKKLFDALNWLQLLNHQHRLSATTPFDSFSDLLQQKLTFGPKERDLVLLHHDFLFKDPNGCFHRQTATICEYGEIGGYSAMARTVGFPVAIAAKMILKGAFKATGVQAPIDEEFFKILSEMQQFITIK